MALALALTRTMPSLPYSADTAEDFGRAVRVAMLRAIDGFARSIDYAAPSMDPLIAHLLVDRAIIDRSRNYRNCAINRLRTAEFAQSIDRAALESAQSVDCLRSISSHIAAYLLLVSKYYGFLLHMFYLGLPRVSL